MSTLWKCAVCETVNDGGRSCSACGAPLTRRSAAATAIRGRIAPVPPPPGLDPGPDDHRRIGEPVDEAEWPHDDMSWNVVPLPGGCLFTATPRRREP